MNAWLIRHLQTAIGALGRLAEQRLATFLTMLVIGIALALPACFLVMVMNAREISGDLNRAVDISIYLKPNTTAAAAEQVAQSLRLRSDIADVRLVSADEGLKEFSQRSSFGDALKALNENPLPHALIIRPAISQIAPAQLESLAQSLRAVNGVDVVQLDTAWVERFGAMLDVVRRVGLVVAVLLAFGVLVIVSNVIRTDIQGRRAEIEIVKLVGGTDAFVRRPFLYTGIWYGLGGAAIALSLTIFVVALLNGPVRRLAGLYGSNFDLHGLSLPAAIGIVGAGIFLGWLGSLASTSRHLRQIEPQ